MKRTYLLVTLIIIIVAFSSLSVFFFERSLSTISSSDSCSVPTPTPYITEYCVINGLSSPNAIAVDSSGNVWFVVQNESDLGVFYSANSTIQTFPIPNSSSGTGSWGIQVDNTRKLVWFTDYQINSIVSFNIATRQFTEYNVTSSSFAFPFQLVLDSKGNVWFTEEFANKIGELTTSGKEIDYPLPSQLASITDSGPAGLTMSSNGTLWFTDPNANSIGSFNNGVFHVYNMTHLVTSPVGIAVDSKGNIWLTQHGPSLISEYNPATGFFRSITTHIPSKQHDSLPYFIYVDSNGNVWTDEHNGNAIGRFNPQDNTLVEYRIPTKVAFGGGIAGAITMTIAPNGTPWFTEWFGGKIGKVNLNAPLDLSLSFQNTSTNPLQAFNISNGGNLTISFVASSPLNESANLYMYLSTYNYASVPFSYSFSKSNIVSHGNGSQTYTSTISIKDQGVQAGTYYLTISLETNNLIVSTVIEVKAS
ncbi:MAG: Vgb family protein [Nitrososphaerales archaeon]